MNKPESARQVRSVKELPQAVTPTRDLWPHIHPRLAPRHRSWILPASLAASLLIAALGFVIGTRAHTGAAPQVADRNASALIRASLMNPGYQREREHLLRALPGKLERLPPEAQRRVRDSLLAVQTAMQNIQTELGLESGNALLQELFISTCQEEMRVLTAIDDIDGSNQEI
jgi:hypothetical protein